MKCYFNQLKMHVNLWVTDDNGSCLNPHSLHIVQKQYRTEEQVKLFKPTKPEDRT